MTFLNSLTTLTFVLASTTAFGMGNHDFKAAEPKLQEAKAAGYECVQNWSENWRDLPDGTPFEVAVECKHAASPAKSGVIMVKARNALSKCPDLTAISIQLEL